MLVRYATAEDWNEWRAMRLALWPHANTPEDDEEMLTYIEGETTDTSVALVAQDENGELIGFLESNIRYAAEGCSSGRVGYIEGWYVKAENRRQGVGAALVRKAEEWARRKRCQEMASDCELPNEVSRTAHVALGYEEVNRLIHFKKTL